MEIPAYSVIFLAIGSSIYTIVKNPFSGVYLTIFFLPLTKTVKLQPYDFGSKIGLPIILFSITLLAYLLKGDLLSRHKLRQHKEDYYLIPLGFFIFFSLISGINAISIIHWGVDLISNFFLAVFFIVLIKVLDSEEKISKVLKILILSLSITIVLGFIGYILHFFDLQNPFFSKSFKLTSTFKSSNQFPLSVFVGFYLLVNEAQKRINKKDPRGVFIFSLICAIGVFDFALTGSRVALLILFPILLLYVVLYYFTSKSNKYPIVGVFLILVVIGLLYTPFELLPTPPKQTPTKFSFNNLYSKSNKDIYSPLERSTKAFNKAPETLSDGIGSFKKGERGIIEFFDKYSHDRGGQFEAFFGMINDHPLLGVGAGNFKAQRKNYQTNYTRGGWMHNSFLNISAETGALGFISFASFLTFIFVIGVRKFLNLKSEKYRNYILMIMLGLISTLAFQIFHLGVRNLHMWLGFALVIAINKNIKN
jgi:O-antigen ligase